MKTFPFFYIFIPSLWNVKAKCGVEFCQSISPEFCGKWGMKCRTLRSLGFLCLTCYILITFESSGKSRAGRARRARAGAARAAAPPPRSSAARPASRAARPPTAPRWYHTPYIILLLWRCFDLFLIRACSSKNRDGTLMGSFFLEIMWRYQVETNIKYLDQ